MRSIKLGLFGSAALVAALGVLAAAANRTTGSKVAGGGSTLVAFQGEVKGRSITLAFNARVATQ